MKQYVKADENTYVFDKIHDNFIDMQDSLHEFMKTIDIFRQLSEGVEFPSDYGISDDIEDIHKDLEAIDKEPGANSWLDELWIDIEDAINDLNKI